MTLNQLFAPLLGDGDEEDCQPQSPQSLHEEQGTRCTNPDCGHGSCPSEDLLIRYAQGETRDIQQAAMEIHLRCCSSCHEKLAIMIRGMAHSE